MNNKTILGFVFIGILICCSISPVFSYIPPTNAFDHITTSNDTVYANDYEGKVTYVGSGISITASNNSKTIYFTNTVSPSTLKGTYNQTQANNVNVNSNGYKINFINGSGATVHIENSKSGTQVNVTISATGTTGVTSLNGTTGAINIHAHDNGTNISLSSGTYTISSKPNNVLTNGSKQFFTKDLDFGQAVKDIFANAAIYIRNVASTFTYNIVGGAITGNFTLTLPPITGNDILPALNLSQNFTKKQLFTQTSTTAPINLGGTNGNPTSPRANDMWFNGFDLRWNDFQNNTRTAATTQTTQTLGGKTVSSLAYGTASKSANYTATSADLVIFGTGGAGGITITLPAANSKTGQIIEVIKVDSGAGAVSVKRAGSDTIEGSTTAKSLATQYDKIILMNNGGTVWYDMVTGLK